MKYPFTPEILDAMPEYLAALFRGLEDDLLRDICSRLATGEELNQVGVEDIRALRSHGIDLKNIQKAILEYSSLSEEHLDEILNDVVKKNQTYYGQVAEAVVASGVAKQVTLSTVTEPARLVNQRDIDVIKQQTKNEVKNITRSMGFAVREGGKVVRLLPAADAYYWALDKATVSVMAGNVSYNQAITKAVKELANSGLKTIVYDNNGRRMYTQTDVAARRAVMTGIAQINGKYKEEAAERLGTDLYEVSAHPGARDTGDGWQNHADWQGKVYSIRDDDPEYPSIYEVCGLGEVDGLEGVNCRHQRFPYFRGFSERSYTDQELKDLDPKPFAYEGKTYTAYEATQKQREIERTVRKLERQTTAFKAAGLKEEADASNARSNALRKKYKEFSKAADLFTQPERMAVYY